MKTLPICTLLLFLLLWLMPVANRSFLQPTPALAQSTIPDRLSNVTQVAIGGAYTCALTTNNGVNCWGQTNLVSTMQALRSNVTAISINGFHNCALTNSNRALC
jgi:Regulator of chromosome condensation (RCC1) repeat